MRVLQEEVCSHLISDDFLFEPNDLGACLPRAQHADALPFHLKFNARLCRLVGYICTIVYTIICKAHIG